MANDTTINSATLLQALNEMIQKVESSLLPSIQSHVQSSDFTPNQGLDFLDTKNTVLLSYLIDLILYIQNRLNGGTSDAQNVKRLTEMKVMIDKMRGLDKKLRYQIDKLLAAGSTASRFATGAIEEDDEDPLQFRPNLQADDDDEMSNSSEDGDDDNHDDGMASDEERLSGEQERNDGDGDELDQDLAAARMTISMAKASAKNTNERDEEEDENDGIYRAPRLTAVPYTHDEEDKQAQREKRQRRRLRASELAQTLRSQFGDAPEQEDVHGGTELGKQREAAVRLAQREAEKTQFEEDAMVRLTVTRKERKERQRLMREETSNLNAIADLGNIVRGVDYGRDEEDKDEADRETRGASERFPKGSRKRERMDFHQRDVRHTKKNYGKPKNALQSALFASPSGGGQKKQKGKSRR